MTPCFVFHRPAAAGCVSALLLTLASAPALAAPPQTAYLEQAQTQASGGQIRSFGVPTTDATGKLFYWDLTLDLAIGSNGKPSGNATVTAIKQVVVRSNRIVAGTYTDSWAGGTCTVNSSTLPSGRQEASISCVSGSYYWHASVNNGSIAGHPFELQLLAANIGAISGYQDYLWGINGSSNFGCMATNGILSARQVGAQIVATYYGADNISNCGLTLTPLP